MTSTPDNTTNPAFVPSGFSNLKRQKIGAMLVLLSQAGIVVTGSIVRVTASGLGCVTWPNCQPGSLVPVKGAAPALHQAIEWGNRLLTFVVAAAALYCFIQVMRAGRRKEIKLFAFLEGIGVIVQAIIGGISVHLELRWWIVALHFLPSMILVWMAALLYEWVKQPDNGTKVQFFPTPLKYLAAGTATALALVIITGTMVTGAGQHSGDTGVGMDGRLDIDLVAIAHIHAHFMYLYLGLTVGLVVALFTVKTAAKTTRLGVILIGFTIVQAAIGIIQYNWGVPRWTVPFHVGLSGVVVAYMGFLYAQGEKLVAPDDAVDVPEETTPALV
ncbi:COX15/CtaA family protein [Corynebacterium aquilae]|uniref:COX15/CtaA family protein n=1 Tax=Corynebacterium aquilae TaxID=203263 RepID=UPI000951C8E7|nr:heme A synthase [Corynebacterium aquilae]